MRVYSEVSSSWSHPDRSLLEGISTVSSYFSMQRCVWIYDIYICTYVCTGRYIYRFKKINGNQLYMLFWHIMSLICLLEHCRSTHKAFTFLMVFVLHGLVLKQLFLYSLTFRLFPTTCYFSAMVNNLLPIWFHTWGSISVR